MLKPIPTEPGYFASDSGEIWSAKRSVLTKLTPQIRGKYCCVYIVDHHSPARRLRHAQVHHLVLLAFVGVRPEGFEGSHLNGIKADNRPDNLIWETPSDNAKRRKEHGTAGMNRGEKCHFAKLNADQVIEIKKALAAGWPARQLALYHSTSTQSVKFIHQNRSWKHIPWPQPESGKIIQERGEL